MLIFINKTTQVVKMYSHFNLGEQSWSQITTVCTYYFYITWIFYLISWRKKVLQNSLRTGKKGKSVLFTYEISENDASLIIPQVILHSYHV